MDKQFYLVRNKQGFKYRLRDGFGFNRPMKEVSGAPVPFLFRPIVDELNFDVQEINCSLIEDLPTKRQMEGMYRLLEEEHAKMQAKYDEALSIQEDEKGMHGGKYVRSVVEIMKDPHNTSMRDTIRKIAGKRAAQADAMMASTEIDAGELGEETAG